MSMSVSNSLAGLTSLYAASSAPATSASAPAATSTASSNGIPADETITDEKTLTTKIAQEQLAYLTQMQSAFQAGLLASGIVDSDAAPLIFGTGTNSVLSLLDQPSAPTTNDDLVATPGLSSLGASVLSGKTALQDVIDAGTKNAKATHQPDSGYTPPPPPADDTTA